MIRTLKITFVLSSTALLAACGVFSSSKEINSNNYVKAQNANMVQTKIIREYIPVAVPGQLMPIPSTSINAKNGIKKKFLNKEAAVKYANQHAQVYPDQNDFFNAMMTYSYMPGAVYTIYAAPLKITDIVLQKNEKLISQAAGDTLRWQIAQTYSGEGDDVQQHILVKPTKPGLENSIVITTNKRTYHLLFKSVDSSSYMISVKWTYPGKMVKIFSPSELPEGDPNGVSGSDKSLQLNLSNMKFDYHWEMYEGDTPSWYPQQIFSSNRQTFVKFSDEFWKSNGELPVLVVQKDKNTKATMVNWRVRKPYMIVDSVFKNGFLKTGVASKSETIVQISQKT